MLSAQAAADLHRAFVYDMIDRFRDLPEADFELHTDMTSDAWVDTGVTRKVQISGHLGLKLIHGLSQGLRAGYQRSMIVGSDAPTLPANHLRSLLSSNADVALGPAEDGGFYAISARRTHPDMFDLVTWSQASAMTQTIAAVERCGLTVEVGPRWFDIDEPSDLDRLRLLSDLPPQTAAAMDRLTAAQQGIG